MRNFPDTWKHVADHLPVFFSVYMTVPLMNNIPKLSEHFNNLASNAAARFLKCISLYGDIRIKSLKHKSLDKMQNKKN